jgi:PAS domain S-box-containing protein
MTATVESRLSRAKTMNLTRMIVLVAFATATVLGHLFVAAADTGVLVAVGMYVVLVILYQPILRRTSTAKVDRLQLVAFMADITFLSIIYAGLNAWWLSSTVHGLIAMGACASLAWRRARIVVSYAIVMFVLCLLVQVDGPGPQSSFLGAPTLHGNYPLAFGVAFLGVCELIAIVYIQLNFLRLMTRSEKRQRLIITAASEWVVTTNTLGDVTSANEATFLRTGLSSNDVLGEPFGSLLEQESRTKAVTQIRATLRDGISRTFLSGYRSARGALSWIRFRVILLSENNVPTGVLIVGNDATDRIESTEKHRVRDALLAQTEQLVHLGTWEWHFKTDLIDWSDELYRIFRIERNGPMTSARFFSAVHPDDLERVRATLERSMQTGEAFSYDHRIVVEPDETRTLHVVARVVLNDAGSPTSITGSAQDITEQNMLSDQLRQSQKMEAVGRLAGGVAHDFNNVLTVIKSYAGFLIDTLPESGRAHADAVEIGKAVDKAALLTKQLGVFSRREIVELQVTDLNNSITGVRDMLGRLVGEDVKFDVHLEPALWCVRADARQLEQVLMNLVVNARDALSGGGVIKIETANVMLPDASAGAGQETGGRRFAMMSVCDTGCGMTQDTQTRIFEPFFTTKESGKGTGLGMSMVYGIVNQSGGRIAVQSEVGKGTTISLYFPQVHEDTAVAAAAAPFAGVRGGTETILLVEDEDPVRTIVARILRGAGYGVLEASNGVDAASMWELRSVPIDILITDMIMPKMGGRELAMRVRLKSSLTPILFMSAYTEDPIAVSGGSGNERFIGKPFSAEELLPAVRSLLDGAA